MEADRAEGTDLAEAGRSEGIGRAGIGVAGGADPAVCRSAGRRGREEGEGRQGVVQPAEVKSL